MVWDLSLGKLETVVEQTGRGDGVIFDPVADRFFIAASGFGEGPMVGIFDREAKFLTNVPTARMASWVAYDQTHNLLYFPTVVEGRPAIICRPNPTI